MKNQLVKILAISLSVSLLAILALQNGLLDSWQEKVFDRLFLSQKPSQDIVIIAVDNESIAQIGQWPWPRKIFADAVNKLQPAKVIGIDINFSEPSRINPADDTALRQAIDVSGPDIILPVQINTATGEIVRPIPLLAEVSMTGVVNLLTDTDGTVRQNRNFDKNFRGFGMLAAAEKQPGLDVPELMRINYAGAAKTFLTFPISDLLNDKIPERIFENKIALIGATAPDFHDYFQTPSGLISGVEIHANIAATLLGQKFFKNLPFFPSVISFLLFNSIAALIMFRMKKFSASLPSLAAIFIAINILGAVLFSYKIIFPVLYADIGFLAAAGAILLFQYATESKEKKFIQQSFGHYVSHDVLNELLKDPSKLKTGGEKKKITMLFSDIRDFTTISEGTTPEVLTHVMNAYFNIMGDAIMRQKGLIDKYIGDAIFAFWGAPIANAEQAQSACRAAVGMVKAAEALNSHLKAEGFKHAIKTGIGINTGEAVVGNMGSDKRFSYTALGDQVNFSSRLEGLTKMYGVDIIISESTKKEVQSNPEFLVRELDEVIVKGKKEPKKIFELMAKPVKSEILENFTQGKFYYTAGDFAKAMECFAKSAQEDGPSNAFLERCQEFLEKPPKDWKGIYEFKSK